MSTNTVTSSQSSKAITISGFVQASINLIIMGLWLWLYRPVFDYLAIIFSKEDFRTNQIVLAGVIVLIVARSKKREFKPRLQEPPRTYYPALILVLGCSISYLLVERFLDINTVSGTLFGLATYGLLGLWISPKRWRQGIPAALLLIGTLPFGEHMQTFIGYPARILTAAIVRDGLATTGIASVGIDTILILENGVSQVDIPCSGVKSLWTGMLFLIAATWIERRPLNRRWIVTAMLFVLLLFIANLARVAVLVVVGQVAGWMMAAEMLHIPLGILGFVGSCTVAAFLLKRQSPPNSPSPTSFPSTISTPRSAPWFAPALASALMVMVLVYTPRPQTGLTQSPPSWKFPAGLNIEPMPLKPDEIEWLTRDGADSADRQRFEWRGLTGSMILISSHTWRAHHRPERCFEVYGLSIDDSRTHLLNSEFPLRLVSLGDGNHRTLNTAAYWFQSSTATTDDYANRMWADLAPERDRWVLISILFDDVQNPQDPDVKAFYFALHEAIAGNLSGGNSS